MKFAIVLAAMLLVSVIAQTAAFGYVPNSAAGCPTTEQLGSNPECLRDLRESGKEVKFVDMYFSEGVNNLGGNQNTNIPTKMEVAPGDGVTNLVAVMANGGTFVLTGMRGWLSLPIGFQAAGRAAGEPAFDTYDLAVGVASVFDFEFPVVVTENTRVGMYNATLHVEYYNERNIGLSHRDIDVQFLLTGKSVLDARSTNPVLYPSTNNNATIEIVNDGSAPASGAIVKLLEGQSQIVSVGSKIWNLGVIKPHSKVTIDPILYVNPTLANTRQNLQVEIDYFDAYGQKQTVTIPVSFVVAGTTSESIDFRVNTDKPVIPTITQSPLKVSIYNDGVEPASSVEVTVSTPITATVALNQQVPEASKSPIMVLGGDGYTKIDTIKPGEKADINVTLFASQEAVNTAYQLPVTISYLDQNGGSKLIQRFVSVYVQGTIKLHLYDLGITYIGNQPNLSGYLLNEGTNTALFTTVQLMGGQNLTNPSQRGHQGFQRTALEQAQGQEQAQNQTQTQNQTPIRQAGGSQYLGDLTANSPLPFNIPIRLADGVNAGRYPVTIRVAYSDDLRAPFENEINGMVPYAPQVTQGHGTHGSSFDLTSLANMQVLIGVSAAGVAGYYFVRKKLKTRIWTKKEKDKDKDKITSNDDIDFLNDTKQ